MNNVVVCNVDDVGRGRGKRVIVEDEDLVLFNVDGRVCAVRNMCPHQKFQKLHEGMFENGIVTCPMHGWSYDVRTGISTNADGKLKVYDTEVKNGKVIVKIDSSFL